MTTIQTLTQRELNRALLARQLLLERQNLTASEAIQRLVGLQAQVPDAPYIALWSRLIDYRPDTLADDVAAGRAVRLSLMRSTIHLVTDRDALALQPVFQAVTDRSIRGSSHMKDLSGLDVAAILAEGQQLLAELPRTRIELGRLLAERWPGVPPGSLGMIATSLTPTMQVPPRGVWRSQSGPVWAPIETLLGQPPGPPIPLEDLVRRYLTAFGPASVADMSRWSGLQGLAPVVRRLRPELRIFRNPAGQELFDNPDGQLPDPETPAPPRFLAEYDNVLLSHRDRSRIMAVQELPGIPGGYGASTGTVLIDGMLGATWKLMRDRTDLTLSVAPYEPLTTDDGQAIADEGERLLRFIDPTATGSTVRFEAPGRPVNPWAEAAKRPRPKRGRAH